MTKVKILCTLGPSSSSPGVVTKLIENGMNAVRINTSHGVFDQYRHMIQMVRQLANIPIVMDTQGPKIRLRTSQPLTINPGFLLRVGYDPSCDFYLDSDIHGYIQAGDTALIDDGGFEAMIEEAGEKSVTLRFLNGGTLVSGRAVNFPKKTLPLASLTEKDIQLMSFAKEMRVDYIALSFTRGKEDIQTCRSYLEGSRIKIIAKIENQQGIDNIEEIVENADGVMVARGDLGVELPPEEIPIIQKKLIAYCGHTTRMVITATQMLQSMIEHPRPTRAETSDVANAILDGSDVLMLSGETAAGKYPIESVRTMSKIARYSEHFIQSNTLWRKIGGIERMICDSIYAICKSESIDKIVCVTRSGQTAKLISLLRLQQPVIAITSDDCIYRELCLYYGIHPVWFADLPETITTPSAASYLFEQGLLREQDTLLFASSEYSLSTRKTNTIQILKTSDLLEYHRSFQG